MAPSRRSGLSCVEVMDARVVGVHLDIPCGSDGVGVEKILWHAALIFYHDIAARKCVGDIMRFRPVFRRIGCDNAVVQHSCCDLHMCRHQSACIIGGQKRDGREHGRKQQHDTSCKKNRLVKAQAGVQSVTRLG